MKTTPTRFPGLARHARILKISQSHLYRMLKGERQMLPPLRRRYDALLRAEENAEKNLGATLPAGTIFKDCHPWQIKEIVSQLGDKVRVDGSQIILNADIILTFLADIGAEMRPETKAEKREAASSPAPAL